MAKRKRRRPNAGPPPAPQRRTPDKVEESESRRQQRAGAPAPPSFKSVLIRAGFVLAAFAAYLLFIAKEDPETTALITVIAAALMLPLGVALDRLRYRMQMRRWERRQAGDTAER
jgi:hypothetical protein